MEKIDFLKKGITDFFPNFFITFSKVQRNIFNEKSHSNRKTNFKVDLDCSSLFSSSLNFIPFRTWEVAFFIVWKLHGTDRQMNRDGWKDADGRMNGRTQPFTEIRHLKTAIFVLQKKCGTGQTDRWMNQWTKRRTSETVDGWADATSYIDT